METPVYKITSGGSPGSVYIGNFHRDGSIGPDAFAQLAWLPDTGLQIKMWSYDRFPISNCTDPNGPINKDSYLAVCKQPIPDMEPHKVDNLVDTTANGSLFAVQKKRIIASLPEKSGFDGIQADIAPNILKQTGAIDAECLRQSFFDLRLAGIPMMGVPDYPVVDRFFQFRWGFGPEDSDGWKVYFYDGDRYAIAKSRSLDKNVSRLNLLMQVDSNEDDLGSAVFLGAAFLLYAEAYTHNLSFSVIFCFCPLTEQKGMILWQLQGPQKNSAPPPSTAAAPSM